MSVADLPIPMLVLIAIVVLYLLNSIKILRDYERAVIFRLGRALSTPKGPGIILVFRPLDQMIRISLRQEVLEVPHQDVITRDNVTIKVNAVVTFYVVDPNMAAIKVANYVYQTSQLAQTTLRTRDNAAHCFGVPGVSQPGDRKRFFKRNTPGKSQLNSRNLA